MLTLTGPHLGVPTPPTSGVLHPWEWPFAAPGDPAATTHCCGCWSFHLLHRLSHSYSVSGLSWWQQHVLQAAIQTVRLQAYVLEQASQFLLFPSGDKIHRNQLCSQAGVHLCTIFPGIHGDGCLMGLQRDATHLQDREGQKFRMSWRRWRWRSSQQLVTACQSNWVTRRKRAFVHDSRYRHPAVAS